MEPRRIEEAHCPGGQVRLAQVRWAVDLVGLPMALLLLAVLLASWPGCGTMSGRMCLAWPGALGGQCKTHAKEATPGHRGHRPAMRRDLALITAH